jgi:hypothetical protein
MLVITPLSLILPGWWGAQNLLVEHDRQTVVDMGSGETLEALGGILGQHELVSQPPVWLFWTGLASRKSVR